MLILALALSLHPQVNFPQHPKSGEYYMYNQMIFTYDGLRWIVIGAQPLIFKGCNFKNQHLHQYMMNTSIPDTKTNKLPVPDGRCHYDKTDEVVKEKK